MKQRPTPRSLFSRVACIALLSSAVIGAFVVSQYGRQVSRAATYSDMRSVSGVSGVSGIGGCPFYPADNIWNYDISHLPVNGNSTNYIKSIGAQGVLHPDFGTGTIGIPFTKVPASQPYVPVKFTVKNESDSGPYPIPPNAPVESGGDRHVLVVDKGTCELYEMFHSHLQSDGSWHAYSGATWNLKSDALRPAGWTSADAAGLPILPGLVTYDEVASGVINHALRFTVSQSQMAYLWPARHFASSSTNKKLPPMGLRLRLKASVDISHFSRKDQVILTTLKHYGMFVADNGSSWYLSGAPDSRWNNNDLHLLDGIVGSDFEAVDESSLIVNPNSGQTKQTTVASETHSENGGLAIIEVQVIGWLRESDILSTQLTWNPAE